MSLSELTYRVTETLLMIKLADNIICFLKFFYPLTYPWPAVDSLND